MTKVIALQIEVNQYNDHATPTALIQSQWYGGQERDADMHRALYDSMTRHLREVARRKAALAGEAVHSRSLE